MTLASGVKESIREAMRLAVHGSKGETARRLALQFGVSVTTIYRYAERGGSARKRLALRPEYRDWVRVAVCLSWSAGPGRSLPLDLALRAGIESGRLPAEAAAMPLGSAYRIARELCLLPQPGRTQRMSAEYPMQAVQMDGSGSEYLYVEKALGDGDYLLRLYRRPWTAKGYKNKPVPASRLRVWLYSLWDMCTGYHLSRYCVALGEAALDAMDFLCWALSDEKDPRLVLQGLPDNLWSDQGPLVKNAAAGYLLERLGINVELGEPYRKTRMGGVERTHRTRWQRFERALFLRGGESLRLSELNERLVEWTVEENGRPARVRVGGRTVTRRDAWVSLTNGRPAEQRLRKLPANPMSTLAREARRWVDSNGIFRWDGEYELGEVHSAWVTARRGVNGDGGVVVETEAGERYLARPLRARPYGEVRRGKASPLEQALDGAEPLPGVELYAPGEAEPTDAVVTPLPARVQPAAALDNPLDFMRHASLDEAMRAFYELYPHPVSEAQDRLVRQIIGDRGCNRQAVVDLAQEMLTVAVGRNN